MRNIYLETTELEKAIQIFQENIINFFENKDTEWIDTEDAYSRVAAEAVFAKNSSPSYHSSSMDGVMVKSSMTKFARESEPLFIKNEDFKFCNTGDMLVKPYDAVIMIEDVKLEEGGISILKPVNPWHNIRLQGEDVIEEDLIYTAYHKFESVDLSVLISCGIDRVKVLKKPIIGIIPTGNEIISHKEKLTKGKIIESNSTMLVSMARKEKIDSIVYPIVADNKDDLSKAIKLASKECDFICVLAGSSAGSKDYIREILEQLGEVFVHGISIKPGKPALLGKIDDKPFVGLPGYPVSTHIIFEQIVIPTILKKLRISPMAKPRIKATLTKQVISSLKNREYVRVKIGKIANKLSATALDRRAGSLYSLAESDGYLIIDRNKEGYRASDEVEIVLHKPISDDSLEKRLISIGSHDIVLDIINDLLAINNKNTRLISSHVGSMSGLKALKEGNCHIAPSHLLDRSGTYNNEAIDLFFDKNQVSKISVVGRRQGIYVAKGNPLNIKKLDDLKSKTMVNRQRGAGTRVLFDYLLEKNNIDSNEIIGYNNEVTTHLQAALAVKNGDCDFSIGVESAAIKMDIDFIYLKDEEYEFIIKNENLSLESIAEITNILGSDQFKNKMESIGGYNTKRSGKINKGEKNEY